MNLTRAEQQRNLYANVIAACIADGVRVTDRVIANWRTWDAAVQQEAAQQQ